MTEKERLIELLADAGLCHYDTIADHLLANGVIVPPCKVGDTVYSIVPTYSKCHLGASWDEIRCQGCEDECDSHGVYAIRQELVHGIAYNGSWSALTNKSGGNYKQIGSKIYGLMLTREEAEKALAERGQQ